MKKVLKHILFGKPAQGKPLIYHKEIVISKTTTPFNVSYDIWEQSVKDYGYQNFINWLIKIHK